MAAKKQKGIQEILEVPSGITASLDERKVNIRGPKGELERTFKVPVKIELNDNKFIFSSPKSRKLERRSVYTTISHIKNMFKGVQEEYVYKLQICFVHFPSTVTLDKEHNLVRIKNFLGESTERTSRIIPGVKVEIEKDVITVSGCDKEKTGQTAANLETATKIKSRDQRVFQDGIFISEKPGEK